MKNIITQKNIPHGWDELELHEFADLIMGQSPSSESYNKNGEGLPFFQGNADFIKNSKYPVIRQWTTRPTKISESNSILFTVRAPVGDVFFNNTKACIGRGLASLNVKKGNSQIFLYYYLQSLGDQFKALSQGSTFTAINSNHLRQIKIIKPKSIKEQDSIANILVSVDDDIAKTQEVIEATEKMKHGLTQQLFTRGIGHTKLKKTKLGEIPEAWEIKKLSSIGEIITGNTPKTSDKNNYGDEFLFVSPKDIGLVKYINNSEKKLSKKGFSLTRKIPKGSVLMVCIGSTIGKIGIAGRELSTNQQINSVAVDSHYSSEYIYYQLLHRRKDVIGRRSTQAVPIINKTDFSLTELAVPKTKNEQEEIAEILSAIDEKISINKKLKVKLIKLKKGLMQDLLSGKVRV